MSVPGSSGRADVAVVGQVARDLVLRIDELPEAGVSAAVAQRRETLGGKGANQAVALAQLGGTVGLVGVVGDDDTATAMLDRARQDGIDVRPVIRRAGAETGLIVEVLEAGGHYRYLEHLPDTVLLTEDDIAARADVLAGARAVTVQLQQPAEAALAAARVGRAAGRLVVLDGVPATEQADELLDCADALRADAREAELLAGEPITDPRAALRHARGLLDRGPTLVALGVAGQGDVFAWPGGELFRPHAEVPVVDTTGAGDALVAALTLALVRGAAPDQAARMATTAASISVRHAGGRPRLRPDLIGAAPEAADRQA
jgi:ribokinase